MQNSLDKNYHNVADKGCLLFQTWTPLTVTIGFFSENDYLRWYKFSPLKCINVKFSERRLTMLRQKVNQRIDLRGMEYPLSKLETHLTLKNMAAGDVLEVLADFVPIRQTISLLIRELGYAYELIETDTSDFRFFIQKT